MDQGIPFIITAPSGTGKSTLLKRLMVEDERCRFSVSHTTRPARSGETHGVDYYFCDVTGFERLIEGDDFLEWARVHDHYYGTSRSAVAQLLDRGRDVFMDIDVQGAAMVRGRLTRAVSIFIMPPSFQSLERRLVGRAKDTPEVIGKRLRTARSEIKSWQDFDYLLINDELDACYRDLRSVVRAERLRCSRQVEQAQRILDSFRT